MLSTTGNFASDVVLASVCCRLQLPLGLLLKSSTTHVCAAGCNLTLCGLLDGSSEDPVMNISTCADSAYYFPCFCRYFRGNRLLRLPLRQWTDDHSVLLSIRAILQSLFIGCFLYSFTDLTLLQLAVGNGIRPVRNSHQRSPPQKKKLFGRPLGDPSSPEK